MLEEEFADGAVVPLGSDGCASHGPIRGRRVPLCEQLPQEVCLLDEEVEGVAARPAPVLSEMGQLHRASHRLEREAPRVPPVFARAVRPNAAQRAGDVRQGAEEARVEEPAGTIIEDAVRAVVLRRVHREMEVGLAIQAREEGRSAGCPMRR